MLRFGETKVTKEKFYTSKKPLKIWDVHVDNIVMSKLLKATSSKYLIGQLDKVTRPLVLIMSKMRGYVNISDIVIITIENADYCCIIHNIRKPEVNLLENSVLEERGYI